MTYVCENCITVYKKKYKHCPRCNNEYLAEIDDFMIDLIIEFWRSGFETNFCCSGHIWHYSQIPDGRYMSRASIGSYISFIDERKEVYDKFLEIIEECELKLVLDELESGKNKYDDSEYYRIVIRADISDEERKMLGLARKRLEVIYRFIDDCYRLIERWDEMVEEARRERKGGEKKNEIKDGE